MVGQSTSLGADLPSAPLAAADSPPPAPTADGLEAPTSDGGQPADGSSPGAEADSSPAPGAPNPAESTDSKAEGWKTLFDGKSLDGWKSTEFGGEGEIFVEDATLVMEAGQPLTGVTYTGDFPKQDYEIRLEAMKVDGIDFFCGLTFPVGESHCSFIVGGWAGSLVGISSIDGQDASENETTRVMKFDKGTWYKIRVRVTLDKLEAWIDDYQIVDQDIKGRRISTRNEVNASKPMGISAFETKAALRGIEFRSLNDK